MAGWTVRAVVSAADRTAAFAVRSAVFQHEQGVPAELEFDADDAIALHVIVAVAGEVVGTGRLLEYADHAKIGRMAVLAPWRGRGVGRALLDFLVGEAGRRGHVRIVLHAQVRAQGFYERAGFTAVGDVFDEAGIPHRRMERRVAAR
jgi:predicted GNAT family N-acyltransferase